MNEETKNHIKLVSLNIELDKHLDIIFPFLEKQASDVFCLQELFEPDFEDFEKNLKMKGFFIPMAKSQGFKKGREKILIPYGVGFFSSLPIENPKEDFYYGGRSELKEMVVGDRTTINRVFFHADVIKNSERFTIGTTHFTWNADGKADNYQRKDLKALFAILNDFPEIVFCGDFNTPRGGEIFNTIAKRYKDNIPEKYKTSIDSNFHQAGHLMCMVDALFSTFHFNIKNVKLVSGLSDHYAVIANVFRA
ncbi:MAG: Endonuclease/exonuclease/phosphatase [Candidatus Daviesbacteria bacterium GW2011_GWC2_40_12]|uniref:Endonuclease/exonuclease/phosphatase n=1 Tax=Candidatus Daviesbacteria bacterium GW2011_GWC2_40_12 TaxID=1618431 RepID=A0A0G0QTF9_9BACT|nr:MAG: Endonuclease/exonuclease/phosphatase [Candidatus Daviesbacteria bacterium GW2011_GWC2_40_12]